jgi:type IV secretory pathway TrbD component
MEPQRHHVFLSLNKPLTLMGAERRLFFFVLSVAAALWNLFGSLFGGLMLFIAFHALACWATRADPQILRIILNSAGAKHRYDPAKWCDPVLNDDYYYGSS